MVVRDRHFRMNLDNCEVADAGLGVCLAFIAWQPSGSCLLVVDGWPTKVRAKRPARRSLGHELQIEVPILKAQQVQHPKRWLKLGRKHGGILRPHAKRYERPRIANTAC